MKNHETATEKPIVFNPKLNTALEEINLEIETYINKTFYGMEKRG